MHRSPVDTDEYAEQVEFFINHVPEDETEGMPNSMMGALLQAEVHLVGTLIDGNEPAFSPAYVEVNGDEFVLVFTRLADAQSALDHGVTRTSLGAHALMAIPEGAGALINTPNGSAVLTARHVAELKRQIRKYLFGRDDTGAEVEHVTVAWLLEDVKTFRDVAAALNTQQGDDSLMRYAKFAVSGPGIPDLEDPEANSWDKTARGGRGGPGAPNPSFLEVQRRYLMLGWPGEGYGDVIASWTTPAKVALQLVAEDLDLDYKVPNKGDLVAAIKSGDPEFLAFLKTLEGSKHAGIVAQVRELAAKCHSVANFLVCPDGYFNSDKGTFPWTKNLNGRPVNWDYLNLMVDGIEAEYDRLRLADELGTSLGAKIRRHRDFLLDNRKKYSLDQWYCVKDGRLKGFPVFEQQSHAHPVPTTLEEAAECLTVTLLRISSRAETIALRFAMTQGE